MNEITETLLEMHFHRAIVKLLEETFGAKFLRILKPSTTSEAWVGFDQGWSRTDLSNRELFDQLKSAIAANGSTVNSFYFGYFMQFKLVRQMVGFSKHEPTQFSRPYWRAELSLQANATTGRSQHDTLVRLSQIAGADVSYVCPMMFNIDELYRDPDPDQLQVVEVSSAPTGWKADERHFIAFQTQTGSAHWCSEAVPAKAYPARTWAESIDARAAKRTGPQIVEFLQESANALETRDLVGRRTQLLPESLTLLQFTDLT